MDANKNIIKKVLDDHVFTELNLTQTEVEQFTESIAQKSKETKKTKKSYKFVLPAAAALLVILLSGILLSTFMTDTNNPTASIEEKAELLYGEPILIPEIEGFHILFSAITMLPVQMDQPTNLTISYGKDKGEIDANFNSEEKQKQWEEQQNSILLYGPFTGENVISIQYRKGPIELGGGSGEEKIINGMAVQYEYLQRDAGDFVLAIIHSEDGSYSVEMFITDDLTLEESDEILEEITRQLKS
ncbi:hypothetical protein [Cytobacillus gottheilii]|uniref:hypothetical protein n=1 Tax=Cytobacillus gottheilii TaxID=859144 RepID=UPI0009BA02E4|nr:hypothetical protein [Cytobacillus gottheilii]